ncbi:MAG: hypothetical protein ACT4OP_08480 [Actinomycetota bacterium]
MAARTLAADQAVARRPFTAPGLYPRDLALLGFMLQDLRALLSDSKGGPLIPYRSTEWEADGLRRRVIISDSLSRHGPEPTQIVGFFGERRLERDAAPLEEANLEIVLEFRNYPGILSYSSMELADGNWANLVVHRAPTDREAWRGSEAHARAAREMSPLYYRTVRIHNGVLPGGVLGDGSIVIERTKYWDYRTPKAWQAVRELTTVTEKLAH